MKSFLDSIIPGIRCQNEACQAVMGDRSISLRILLYGKCKCEYCKWEYEGALLGPEFSDMVSPRSELRELQDTGREVAKKIIGLEQAEQIKLLEDLELRGQFYGVMDGLSLRMEDIPIESGYETNEDIRDYIISKLAEKTKPLDKMNREELVAEMDGMKPKLKLEDVPVSGKQVTNGDIKDYIISKR